MMAAILGLFLAMMKLIESLLLIPSNYSFLPIRFILRK